MSDEVNRIRGVEKPESWAKAYHLFQANRVEFDRPYHARSNVEYVFSTLKRKFGENVRPKGPAIQVNGIRCKLIACNLPVLVHERYETGIETSFIPSAQRPAQELRGERTLTRGTVMAQAPAVRSGARQGLGYLPRFEGPGRPTQLGRMIELAKMAWSPVLEMLGKEVRFEEFDKKSYELRAPPMALPEPTNGLQVQHWLGPDDVLRIHDEMIRTFQGDFGIKDPGMIDGTLSRMRDSEVMGHDPIPTIFDKAAFLITPSSVTIPSLMARRGLGSRQRSSFWESTATTCGREMQ